MDDKRWRYLMDLNLAEFTREMVRWNLKGEIGEKNDLLMTVGLSPQPNANIAMRLGDRSGWELSGPEALDAFFSFYDKRKHGFCLYTRQHADADLIEAAEARKLLHVFETPGMVLERPVPEKKLPAGIEIRYATSPEDVSVFGDLVCESYVSLKLSRKISRTYFATPKRVLAPHALIAIAYLDNQPASCAMALFSHGVAGIYWVGTKEEARGKGLAEACTRTLGNEAFKRGAEAVVLQASPFGEPIYRKLGYREVARYGWYLKLYESE